MWSRTAISIAAAAFLAIASISTDALAYRGGYRGGGYHGGVHRGGVYRGGVYRGGAYRGGVYRGGVYRGGVYRGGVYRKYMEGPTVEDMCVAAFTPGPYADIRPTRPAIE